MTSSTNLSTVNQLKDSLLAIVEENKKFKEICEENKKLKEKNEEIKKRLGYINDMISKDTQPARIRIGKTHFCACGGRYTHEFNQKQHERTTKHLKYLKEKEKGKVPPK